MSVFFSKCGSDITISILSLLTPSEFFQCKRVCKEWNQMIEKHREESRISLDSVKRALHFLTWRDVFDFDKTMKKMSKNGAFHYKVLDGDTIIPGPQHKITVGDDNRILPESKNEISSPIGKLAKVIPIENGLITIYSDTHETQVYYTCINRIDSTCHSWLVLSAPFIVFFIGVVKRKHTIAFCFEGIETFVCWFEEMELSLSRNDADSNVREITTKHLTGIGFQNNHFIIFKEKFCLINFESIIQFDLSKNEIENQTNLIIPFHVYNESADLYETKSNFNVFFENGKIFLLSTHGDGKIACVSPCYPNRVILLINCTFRNFTRDLLQEFEIETFVMNDILCIKRKNEKMYCFDFTAIKKEMEKEWRKEIEKEKEIKAKPQENNLIPIQGVEFPYEWIQSNYSFAILKTLEIGVQGKKRKMQEQEAFFHLLHLDSFTYSNLKNVIPMPIYSPDIFQLTDESQVYEISQLKIDACYFCLDGICFEFTLKSTEDGWILCNNAFVLLHV